MLDVHTAHIVVDYLQAVGTLFWLAMSTDRSQIEHIWHSGSRQIWFPQIVTDTEQQLRNGWHRVLQDEIENLYHSLPRRLQVCITTRREECSRTIYSNI